MFKLWNIAKDQINLIIFESILWHDLFLENLFSLSKDGLWPLDDIRWHFCVYNFYAEIRAHCRKPLLCARQMSTFPGSFFPRNPFKKKIDSLSLILLPQLNAWKTHRISVLRFLKLRTKETKKFCTPCFWRRQKTAFVHGFALHWFSSYPCHRKFQLFWFIHLQSLSKKSVNQKGTNKTIKTTTGVFFPCCILVWFRMLSVLTHWIK